MLLAPFLRALAPLLAASLFAAPALAAPVRVMSVNLCTDQLLLALVPAAHIASVSSLARDCEISVQCEAAARTPINYGSAEEVVAAAPDLVVAGRYTARVATLAAKRGGVPLLELGQPTTLDQLRAQIREFARAVGERERGEALVHDFDRRLAAAAALPPGRRPLAAVYQTNGYTVGRGSLIDAALTAAGFDNLAAQRGIDQYPYVPMETLVAYQPDLLVLDTPNLKYPSLGDEMLRHPALLKSFARTRRAVVPHRQWICGGPAVADAVAALARVRAGMAAAP